MQPPSELFTRQSALATVARAAGRHDVRAAVAAPANQGDVVVHRQLVRTATAVRAVASEGLLNRLPLSRSEGASSQALLRPALGVVHPVPRRIAPPPVSDSRLVSWSRETASAVDLANPFRVPSPPVAVIASSIVGQVCPAALAVNAIAVAVMRFVLALAYDLAPRLVVSFQAGAAVVVPAVSLVPIPWEVVQRLGLKTSDAVLHAPQIIAGGAHA